jgi:hypothetical protein
MKSYEAKRERVALGLRVIVYDQKPLLIFINSIPLLAHLPVWSTPCSSLSDVIFNVAVPIRLTLASGTSVS